MRPVPKPRHPLAVLLLAAVAAFYGYQAAFDDRLSDTQVNIACAAIKRQRPETAFRHDPIYGAGELWKFHTPAYHGLLELALVPTGYQDLRWPFRAMAGVLAMVYLCGMYALLYAQCRSWSVSAFVAVLSSRVVEALGGGLWGIGPLESITPAGMVLAVSPLAVLALVRYSRRDREAAWPWRLMLLFGVIGLLGNIHLVTAMNLTGVLLIAYVCERRLAPRALAVAAGCGACALLGALPYAGYYFALRAHLAAASGPATSETIHAALRAGRLAVLYPEMLKELLDWRLLAGALVLGVPAGAALLGLERYRVSRRALWGWMLAAAGPVAFGLHGASQLIGAVRDAAPPAIDFLHASCLLLLPLYVLLAQELTALFRLARDHRKLLRWLCAAVAAAWLLPADNFRVARHAAVDLLVATFPRPPQDDSAPWRYVSGLYDYAERHRERRQRAEELEAVAAYARGRDNAVWLTDQSEFRMQARRAIAVGPTDVRYYYYLCPGRLGEWMERFRRQDELLHPPAGPADPGAIARFVDEQAARSDRPPPAEWYVLLRAASAPQDPAPLESIQGGSWGRHWRVYRVR